MKPDGETESDVLRYEVELDAPLAKVWRAVTIPEFVERWLPARPNEAEAPLSPPVSIRLLDQEACQFVRYGWRDEDQASPESVVTFHLSANEAGGTTFRIVHEFAPASLKGNIGPPANLNRPRLLLAA
jgi:uncharacterized protein YndB with AHSA1/START domain